MPLSDYMIFKAGVDVADEITDQSTTLYVWTLQNVVIIEARPAISIKHAKHVVGWLRAGDFKILTNF